jgi:hypothetical protein
MEHDYSTDRVRDEPDQGSFILLKPGVDRDRKRKIKVKRILTSVFNGLRWTGDFFL